MPRPDPARLARNARQVFEANGETANLRAYVSGTTGAGKFGVQNTQNYISQTVTGLFAFKPAMEILREGGQAVVNRLFVTTETALGARDELDWRGTAYRVDGQPVPVIIGGRLQWRSPLALAAPTA